MSTIAKPSTKSRLKQTSSTSFLPTSTRTKNITDRSSRITDLLYKECDITQADTPGSSEPLESPSDLELENTYLTMKVKRINEMNEELKSEE